MEVSAGASTSKLAGLFGKLTLAIGATVAAFMMLKKMAGWYIEFEKVAASISRLGMEMENARKVAQQLTEGQFAVDEVFGADAAVNAYKKLHLLSDGALASAEFVKALGNAAFATGNSLEQMSEAASLAWSSIAAGEGLGRASMQLRRMGILTDTQIAEFRKMKESGADVGEMWRALTAEINKFDGAIEKSAKSIDGYARNTSDALGTIKKNIGEFAYTIIGKEFWPKVFNNMANSVANWMEGPVSGGEYDEESAIEKLRAEQKRLQDEKNAEAKRTAKIEYEKSAKTESQYRPGDLNRDISNATTPQEKLLAIEKAKSEAEKRWQDSLSIAEASDDGAEYKNATKMREEYGALVEMEKDFRDQLKRGIQEEREALDAINRTEEERLAKLNKEIKALQLRTDLASQYLLLQKRVEKETLEKKMGKEKDEKEKDDRQWEKDIKNRYDLIGLSGRARDEKRLEQLLERSRDSDLTDKERTEAKLDAMELKAQMIREDVDRGNALQKQAGARMLSIGDVFDISRGQGFEPDYEQQTAVNTKRIAEGIDELKRKWSPTK